MIFAYDFPNYKTEKIIEAVHKAGFKIKYVIGAPRVVLKRVLSEFPDSKGMPGSIETRELCKRLDIPYLVFPHNSLECEEFLK